MTDDNDDDGWFVRATKALHTVPCMRTSLLYGIGGGLGSGIGYFLYSSRVKRASDVGVLSFCIITLATFGTCRYSRAKKTLATRRLQAVHGVESVDDV